MFRLPKTNQVTFNNYSKRGYTYSRPINLTSKAAFLESTKNNNTFQLLKERIHEDKLKFNDEEVYTLAINSPHALPPTRTASSMEKKNISDIPNWRRTPTLWYRTGVRLVRLYRDGIQNTFNMYRSYKNYEKVSPSTILMTIESTGKCDLSRKEFVEFMKRKEEFWKIPRFFILLLIFEELTVGIMYIFPKISLHNCLSTNAFKKLSNISAQNFNDKWRSDIDTYRSPYSFNSEEVNKILEQSPILRIPKWKLKLWKFFGVKDKPNQILSWIYQYLVIDDWLLLQHIIRENETIISNRELVNCILERQLFTKDEDLNAMVNDSMGKKILVWRLICYWSFKYDGIVAPDEKNRKILYTEKWGVNNISNMTYPGTVGENKKLGLINSTHISLFKP